jgi:hypothetical protein
MVFSNKTMPRLFALKTWMLMLQFSNTLKRIFGFLDESIDSAKDFSIRLVANKDNRPRRCQRK